MPTSTGWIEAFLRDGFVHLPHLVSSSAVTAARAVIDRDLATNYDPSRKDQYDNQSFCPDLLGSPEIVDLYRDASLAEQIDVLLDRNRVTCDNGQIAIRRAQNSAEKHAPVAHIDGIPTPLNGMEGNELSPFTLLVGIFLSEVQTKFAGNFTVWPGSHLMLERYFNQRGHQAMREGMPKVPLGNPVQLLCSPGDAVLCHYQLAHGAAVNCSNFDRYAVFFRIWHNTLDRDSDPAAKENGWTHLTNIWTDWKISAPTHA